MAEATYFVHVIASNKVFFEGRVTSVTVQTLDGEEQFLAHHDQIILALEPGELRIRPKDGDPISVLAGYGSMVFANNRATILVDTCETADELDERRAKEALERAEERMRQKQSLEEYKLNQAAISRALSRLKYKGRNLQ